jgi:hypothetical protein
LDKDFPLTNQGTMTNYPKKINFAIVIFISAFAFSCRISPTNVDKECLPGHVFLCYLGEANHPKGTHFLRTNDKDTSYMQYSDFQKYDLGLTRWLLLDYCRYVNIDEDAYFIIKKFVLSNDTHRLSIADTVSYSTMINSTRIFIQDKCDTVSYIVNKSDSNYFGKLIKDLKKCKNKDLLSHLRYYKHIQERSSESDFFNR